MIKRYIMIITAVLLVLMLAACGSSSDSSSKDEPQDGGQEQTAEEEPAEAEDTVHPYAWLGLQDMPECDYLDILATNHYIKKSEIYVDGLSYVSKETNAVDGINTFKEDEYSKVYSIDGKVTSINESNKTYMEQDLSDLAETSKEAQESAMETGTNTIGRSYKGTGSEAIPIYSEQGDKDEYEYYEYDYPDMEESGYSSIERFYMKDGDVFAIYNKIVMGESVIETTDVIKSMSGDIPDGTFDLPDLKGYEKAD